MFNSTYFNVRGFHLLKARPPREHRLVFDEARYPRYDVTARAWRPDPDEDAELLVLRAWLPRISRSYTQCRHLVVDAESGLLVADGIGSEGESWKQVMDRMAYFPYL